MDIPIPRPPPIFKLPQELLWLIFASNSDAPSNFYLHEASATFLDEGETTTGTAALITHRNASQVCRRWRELMLRSPSIWANSLKMDVLDQERDCWREVVMKRTGDAPLTIVGNMSPEAPTQGGTFCSNSFILQVLAEQWHRVRSITMCLHCAYHDEKLRLLTLRLAPILEHFTCFMSEWREGLATSEHFIPFSNQAPRLRSFCSQANEFLFSGSSFQNLRHFWMNYSCCVFTAADLLRGLQQMLLLETIFLEEIDLLPQTLEETTPVIELRHLTGISVIENSHFLGPLLYVVPYIKAARGWKLTVFLNQTVREDVEPAIFALFKNNFDPSNTTEICYLLEETFAEGTKLKICFCGPQDEPIYLSVVFLMYREFYDLFYSVAKSLSDIDIHKVKTLKFFIEDISVETLCKHHSIVDVITLFKAFKSVEELYSNPDALHFLATLDKSSLDVALPAGAITLPILSTLRTDGDPNHYHVMEYCDQRCNIGAKLKNIHFKGKRYDHYMPGPDKS